MAPDKSGSDRMGQSNVSLEDSWESAYLRFQTPEQEVRKFTRRLIKMGADRWPRDADIVELFCGSGNSLHALSRLGFGRIQGVDLSPFLLGQYRGPANNMVCDCRRLALVDGCKDIVIIQGGLHHLNAFPDDLEKALSEAKRVLREGGRLMVVEPWLTPFLSFVHAVSRIGLARRLVKKIDVFAAMVYYERNTYWRWLGQPGIILSLLKRDFRAERYFTAWGKLMYVGRKEDPARSQHAGGGIA
jgi:ubiquinone/menaquinone biosynthesis C-methylase UbiE